MDIKEMVQRINGMHTMLVRLTIGDGKGIGTICARPALYDERDGSATLFLYQGPLDIENWARVRDSNGGIERVKEFKLQYGEFDSVAPYETALDTAPLRDLPVWAKELWVRRNETFPSPDGRGRFRMVEQMKRLIERERGVQGTGIDDMSQEMQSRYFRLWVSLSTMDRILSRGMKFDDMNAARHWLTMIGEIVPKIGELPWRTEMDVDTEVCLTREDVYEALLDMLHGTIGSLASLMAKMTEGGEGKKNGNACEVLEGLPPMMDTRVYRE